MAGRRIGRVILLFLPLLLFLLGSTAQGCMGRLSTALHGHPFASIVPKDNVNVFKYVTSALSRFKFRVTRFGWRSR
jgi:hypothetical protein